MDKRTPEEEHNARSASHLFTIRVWQERADSTEPEWRGRLQHVPSGEVLYFRNWDTLVQHIMSMLPGGNDTTPWIARAGGAGGESEPAQSDDGRIGGS